MKKKGGNEMKIFTRNLDDLFRVVIPSEIRRELNLKEKDTVDITIDNNSIIMKKNTSIPHCIVCNSSDNLIEFPQQKSFICSKCKQEISEF